MKSLSKALEPILGSAKAKERSSDTSPTPLPGSTAGAGKPTIRKLSLTEDEKRILAATGKEKLQLLDEPPIKPWKKWGVTLSEDSQGKKTLAEIVTVCFNTLDTFGKTPDQLTDIIKLFCLILGDYPISLVRQAFIEHASFAPVMPKPSDIIERIDSKHVEFRLKRIEELQS